MSYNRVGIPRIFTDSINWRMSHGAITPSDITLGGLSMASGSSLIEMFDLRPSNIQTITANGLSTQCTIKVDTQEGTNARQDANFIAILGHNLKSAGAKINIQIDDSATFQSPWNDNRSAMTDIVNADAQSDTGTGETLTATMNNASSNLKCSDTSSFTAGDYIKIDSEIMYIQSISSPFMTVDRGVDGTTATTHNSGALIYFTGYIAPAYDGWSLFSFDTSDADNKYIRLVIDPDGSGSDTFTDDIKIGAIMIGEYWDFPHSPDLNLKKTLSYDGITRQTSMGGQTYSNATYMRPANWFVNPFMLQSNASDMGRSGRLNIDMKFSYLNDQDVFPYRLNFFPDFSEDQYGDDFISNVVQRTLNGHHPMLFQIDKNVASPSEVDDFLWCRMAKEPSLTQSAPNMWDVDLSLIEEF